MASNTKLPKSVKTQLNQDLAMFSNTVHSWDFVYDEMRGITVFLVSPFKGSNTLHIATSIMSPDEKKFRPSVGRYYAFNNYIAGKYIDTPVNVGVSIFDKI